MEHVACFYPIKAHLTRGDALISNIILCASYIPNRLRRFSQAYHMLLFN